MTRADEADCMALLAQRASIKEAAAMVGVSEWEVANLLRPCRRAPRVRADRRSERLEASHAG